jgi:hypothetical protein
MQHISGLGEASDVNDFHEVFEAAEIQGNGPVAEKSRLKSSPKRRVRVNP